MVSPVTSWLTPSPTVRRHGRIGGSTVAGVASPVIPWRPQAENGSSTTAADGETPEKEVMHDEEVALANRRGIRIPRPGQCGR